jgi:hypothetical protein
MLHWSQIQVGDLVQIKGVRSHLNARHRVAGTVTSIDQHTAVVDCGTRIIHTRPSQLIHLKRNPVGKLFANPVEYLTNPATRSIADVIATMPMYRGARVGDPRVLTGPSYFISSESFARTYGNTASFELHLKKPLLVNKKQWLAYANDIFNPIEAIVRNVQSLGYDSVVGKFLNGQMYTVLLLDPKQATLLSAQ